MQIWKERGKAEVTEQDCEPGLEEEFSENFGGQDECGSEGIRCEIKSIAVVNVTSSQRF